MNKYRASTVLQYFSINIIMKSTGFLEIAQGSSQQIKSSRVFITKQKKIQNIEYKYKVMNYSG